MLEKIGLVPRLLPHSPYTQRFTDHEAVLPMLMNANATISAAATAAGCDAFTARVISTARAAASTANPIGVRAGTTRGLVHVRQIAKSRFQALESGNMPRPVRVSRDFRALAMSKQSPISF